MSFKPYYKWNTFNTAVKEDKELLVKRVLNLIINGIPSIRIEIIELIKWSKQVLNLIINGIPSIQFQKMKLLVL